jgi:hypothetical protein
MKIRSLDILDLPLLPRYRRDELILDNARSLTHGNPLGAAALLSYLNPHRHLYTAIASNNGSSLMGQIIINENETSARLVFLAPSEQIEELAIPLIDHLSAQAGEWGACHLLADIDEHSPVFRTLRQTGFAMYAWERIWKLAPPESQKDDPSWRPAEDSDWPAVQSLHSQIVPALFQPVESLPKQATGLVCRPEDAIQAYVHVNSGPAGIWLQPLMPPESGCAPERLAGLVMAVSGWRDRPIYVCVRSYQAWLESVLEESGAEAGPRQAVMVKRLALLQKADEKVPAMEKVLAKPAAPVARLAIGEDSRGKE